jgi:hypothetical protein
MIEDDRERWMGMRIEVDDRRLKVIWYNGIVSGRGVSDVEHVTEDENILLVMSTTKIYDQGG